MKKTYCFSKVPIFQHLTEDEMKHVSSIITRYEYDTNDYIILAGSKDKKLFIVHEGHAKVSVTSKDGKETVLRFLQSGDF